MQCNVLVFHAPLCGHTLHNVTRMKAHDEIYKNRNSQTHTKARTATLTLSSAFRFLVSCRSFTSTSPCRATLLHGMTIQSKRITRCRTLLVTSFRPWIKLPKEKRLTLLEAQSCTFLPFDLLIIFLVVFVFLRFRLLFGAFFLGITLV